MEPIGSVRTERHALVVERDVIVGLGLAEDLTELGYRVSGPFLSSAELGSLIDTDPPAFAILEIALRDGTGAAIAKTLQDRGIPFVLFSTADRRPSTGDGLHGARWIDKPAHIGSLLQAVGEKAPRWPEANRLEAQAPI